MVDLGRIPPQAIEIEEALLGVLMVDSNSLQHVYKLSSDMFYKECNQLIFTAIQELVEAKNPVDIITVTDRLRKNDKLETVGGAVFVTKLTFDVSSMYGVEYYIAIVKQKFIQREIIRISYELSELSYSEQDTIDECQEKLTELNKFIDSTIVGDVQGNRVCKLAEISVDNAAKRKINFDEGIINGINTGFALMQQILGGWQKQDLVLIAARPSMGKTAVAIHFFKMAVKRGFKALFFSLEMSDISIVDRIILGDTDIDPELWRNGNITDDNLTQYEEASKDSYKWKDYIYDRPGVKPSQIKSICRKELPDIILIDYVQLMKPDSQQQNRNLEIGSISRELKGLAKEFNIPVLVLAQLNRGLDSRGSKIPVLSDLRDSGELEQDADIVIFPFRPAVYESNEEFKDVIQFVIAKHRNGRTGIIDAMHNKYINSFFDSRITNTEFETTKELF